MELIGKEKDLWELIKPYLEGCHFKEGTPQEIIEAGEEIKRMAWENPEQ